MTEPTFVMTLKLDGPSFAILDGLRRRFFPAERNVLPAHLTLLHTMSAAQVSWLRTAWPSFAAPATVSLKYAALRLLGNGVAVDIESDELRALRARLVENMQGGLTRQDQQPFRAHVTLQNKVAPTAAKEAYRLLNASFQPWNGAGTDLLIWKYLGGPWLPGCQLSLAVPSTGELGDSLRGGSFARP